MVEGQIFRLDGLFWPCFPAFPSLAGNGEAPGAASPAPATARLSVTDSRPFGVRDGVAWMNGHLSVHCLGQAGPTLGEGSRRGCPSFYEQRKPLKFIRPDQ